MRIYIYTYTNTYAYMYIIKYAKCICSIHTHQFCSMIGVTRVMTAYWHKASLSAHVNAHMGDVKGLEQHIYASQLCVPKFIWMNKLT